MRFSPLDPEMFRMQAGVAPSHLSAGSFEFPSAQKSAIPDEMIKRNNINMLAARFCVAPMMDWTDSPEK
jgi:hypothetical protein